MRTVQKCALAWGFLCCVVTLVDTGPVQAQKCDRKCRLRQYFYWHDLPNDDTGHYKTDMPTCGPCTDATSLCKPEANDKDVDKQCVVKAGGEEANKWWWTKDSKTVCDFPLTTKTIQADTGTVINENDWDYAHDMYCPPPAE